MTPSHALKGLAMTALDAPAVTVATTAQAREELGKFFALAAVAEQAPGMFSAFIDEEWHRLAESAQYGAFCESAAGVVVRHDPTCGAGVVTWVDGYHARFGELPAVWFADVSGVVDAAAYEEYRATRVVRASWNCSADGGGDSDFTVPTN
jgi:hypothetical protein